ncbi:MAG TPA: SRPBCC family protein [Steroidobacteraceae bacterium]|nr:SRPBCC family protein [Steroidobacteraceae bacterium]
MSSQDRIERVVELKAPVSRVWRAITDHRQFGEWFRVNLDQPFVAGGRSTGHMTYPGYEHLPWLATVERLEPERYFSFRWRDIDDKSALPIGEQPTMLVEFFLEPIGDGTRVRIVESGFSSLSEPRRIEVMRSNSQGWEIQSNNLSVYVTDPP